MSKFANQAALITGAGSGIGLEIARQLAAQGAAVVLNDIDEKLTLAAVDQLQQAGGQASGLSGDAGKMTIIQQLVDQAVTDFGRLDIAIANAGITSFGDFLTFEVEPFQQVIQLNLQGTFFLAQRAARQMIRQGRGGRILLMSSVTGHTFHPDLAAYGMSKAAISALAKQLGVELAPHHITVNALSPGATLTERTVAEDGYRDMWERTIPDGRCATPPDIAQAALFLLSPEAWHITSQTLVIDGGWTSLSPPPK